MARLSAAPHISRPTAGSTQARSPSSAPTATSRSHRRPGSWHMFVCTQGNGHTSVSSVVRVFALCHSCSLIRLQRLLGRPNQCQYQHSTTPRRHKVAPRISSVASAAAPLYDRHTSGCTSASTKDRGLITAKCATRLLSSWIRL